MNPKITFVSSFIFVYVFFTLSCFSQARIPLARNINSEFAEFSPKISPDGKTLYFTRNLHPDNFGMDKAFDIWYSELQADGQWGTPTHLGKPVNDEHPNSIEGITPDGNTLLLSTWGGKGFSFSKKISLGAWGVPRRIQIKDLEIMDKGEYLDASLSNDSKIIIMSFSENQGGINSLYFSKMEEDGSFTKPVNLGENINTLDFDESTPFLASDNKTLYFSSNRTGSFGNNDIYISRRLDDTWQNWSTPENMGPDFNTNDWDAYFTLPASGDYAYVVGYEPNSNTNGELYKVKIPEKLRPEPVCLVKGTVFNGKTQGVLGANVSYQDLSTGKEVGIANSNPDNGTYEIVLPYGKTYSFLASKEGFASVSDNLDLREVSTYKEVERNLTLMPIEIGQTVRMNNLFFETGNVNLKNESFSEIDRLLELMQANLNLEIEIGGHTDNVGKDKDNYVLSLQRAENVKKYLVSKGIDLKKISVKGYGKDKPNAGNDTETGKALNRRVEFTITKK